MENDGFDELIRECIRTQQVQFPKTSFDNTSQLLEKGVILLNEDDLDTVQLNPESIEFNSALLSWAETKLERKVPGTIVEAFSFIEEFQEKLKEENGIEKNVINAYEDIIKGLQSYLLYHLSSGGFNVKSFYLNEFNKERENELFLFEQHLFDFLPYSNLLPKDIWEICQKTISSSDHYYVSEFARHLPRKNYSLAEDLLTLALKSSVTDNSFFIAHLLVGLHKEGMDGVFEKAIQLKEDQPQQSYYILNLLKNLTETQNNLVFDLVSNDNSSDHIGSKTQVLCGLIMNPEVEESLRKKCFEVLNEYLELEEKDSVKVAFRSIVHNLKPYEAEKYQMLHRYLEKTLDFSIINTFFYHLNDPKYLFDLIIMNYRTRWQRGSISKFIEPIYHFWNKSTSETEKIILDLFNPEEKLGMLPVEILMTGNFGALQVDLLKLKTKQEQARAIEAITLFPHSFERLLPILLPLRHSIHPEVVKFLQRKLSELIYDAYHGSLLNNIESFLDDSKEDELFVQPLKETLEKYEAIVTAKEAIKDLDPYENERDLMDLYYNLEHENRAKLMQDINENPKGILAAVGKTTIIVRGNSWKQELENEVIPLGKIESQFTLDARLFKNPDLQEYILNSYDKR